MRFGDPAADQSALRYDVDGVRLVGDDDVLERGVLDVNDERRPALRPGVVERDEIERSRVQRGTRVPADPGSTAPIDQPLVWNVSYATSRQWKETGPVDTRMVKTWLGLAENDELIGEVLPKSELG